MLTNDYAARLLTRNACTPAVDWMRRASLVSLRAGWNLCPRGDWLGWIADKSGVPVELRRLAAFAAADRAVREYAPAALAHAGFGWHADRLASLPPLSSETWQAAHQMCLDASAAAYAYAYAEAAADDAADAADAEAAAADAAAAARGKALAQSAHDLRTVMTWDVVEPYVRRWLGLVKP